MNELRKRKSVLQRMKLFFIPKPFTVPKHIAIKLQDHKGMANENIITISTQDWSDLWTRKQRFVLQFARQGNKVIYVETQFHWVSYFLQFKKQWRRIYLFMLGTRKAEENLYIYTPPLLIPAFQIFPSLAKINNIILVFFLKRVMKKNQMKDPIVWLYTHFNKSLVKKLGCKKALYECVDDYASAKGLIKAKTVNKHETETLKTVSAVIVTADSLKPKMMLHNRNVHIISNAANINHFNHAYFNKKNEPSDLQMLKKPRLVFLGAIQYWVDQKLLAEIAQKRPQWQIVMIGPVAVNISVLKSFKNIHFLGRKDYDLLPDYLSHCNVALNPYKVDGVAEGCSPLKLYEYLAAGLPVVSTEMPEARKFESVVKVAKDYNEYIMFLDELLNTNADKFNNIKQKAINISQSHSWENRFKQVETVLQEVLQ